MTYPLGNAPIRKDYLAKTLTAQPVPFISGVQRATVTMGPDRGQYWYPTFIRVGVNQSVGSQRPTCSVYVGGATVLDGTTYLDDTFSGDQDVTSICAGLMMQNGESITAQWTGQLSNAVCTLTVYGFVTNVPLDAGDYVPSVPGARFAGHLDPLGFASILNGINIPNLAHNVSAQSSLYDLSRFASYNFSFFCQVPGASTAINPVAISIDWYEYNGSPISWSEYYVVYAATTSGGVSYDGGLLHIADNGHGNFCQISFTNLGPDTVAIGLVIQGNSRSLGALYVREDSVFGLNPQAPDNLILDVVRTNIAAGASETRYTRVAPGRVFIRMSTQNDTFTFAMLIAGASVASDQFALAAGTTQHMEYVFPNRGTQWTITNTGATNTGVYVLQIFRQMPPY